MKAYHFLRSDMRSGMGTEPPWREGETRTIPVGQKLKICNRGYHSCTRWVDCLAYAPGPMACLVEVEDVGTRHTVTGLAKQVSRTRTLVAAVDAAPIFPEFTRRCIELVEAEIRSSNGWAINRPQWDYVKASTQPTKCWDAGWLFRQVVEVVLLNRRRRPILRDRMDKILAELLDPLIAARLAELKEAPHVQ